MTKVELQKIEKMAAESATLARKALRKSDELEAYLSLLEYRAGKAQKHASVSALFKKLKLR
ncbi:MAG: hypothetical protein COU11_01150 [Candidatus Harrisonbacteria bacterium CG10_big_fil_rev_8_21_14_0_10_49_15]|uniref:Uncharacterized protein n=1 Tax=Candidatus Harrisonbacteria bacterium CG10_big_fil_rev_8_21_14_0_10_49_15 TaxID=1974587 RepID=A0A2H0ULS6_9BACT|nr:MAG: hypothetical protein COU11_01150 [Candidatus Harrisonbacteria bacterium CG10_big_fil_rev_8_21_14_0_10_49_15]